MDESSRTQTKIPAKIPAAADNAQTLTFRVDDMTCGHCAATIAKAIEGAIPGARVDADPGSKQVAVAGSNDFARLRDIVANAGYTATI